MLVRYLLILIVFTISKTTLCQVIEWPVKYKARYAQIAPIVEGEIITEKNDTIRGFIKEIPSSYPILPYYQKQVIEFNPSKIVKLRLYGHSVISNSTITEIVRFGNKRFWRLLMGDTTIGIYDNVSTAPTFVYGTKMILLHQKRRTRIYSSFSYTVYNGNTLPLLRKFLKRNCKGSCSISADTSTEDILRQIVASASFNTVAKE